MMLDKLDFMVRFWQLWSRHQRPETLANDERVELLGLLQLVASDQKLPEPGPPPSLGNVNDGFPVQLTAPGGFIAGELRLVCAEGLVIASAAPLAAGTSTIVRAADAIAGIEYTLPCVVAWARAGSPSAMALRVDGAPARTNFAIPEPGMWRSPLSWGPSAGSRPKKVRAPQQLG